MSLPNNICKHKNKIVTDSENYDFEVYYECPDCGCGWRQEPETEKDIKKAREFDEIDAKALDIS